MKTDRVDMSRLAEKMKPEKIDLRKLAQEMLDWQTKKEELNVLEKEITSAVRALGKTQTVGNVRATFSKGRGKYDYEKAVLQQTPPIDNDIIFSHSKTVVDWHGVCKVTEIEDIPFLPGNPSVSIKLLE